jgi:hypothetical protein
LFLDFAPPLAIARELKRSTPPMHADQRSITAELDGFASLAMTIATSTAS